MSYITPPYENFTTRRGITDTQLDMIRFTANTPFRLLLRNHAMSNSNDSDDPILDDYVEEEDGICTLGESQPAEDGCNNCVCTEKKTWSCTEIGCPDNNQQGNNTQDDVDEGDDNESVPGLGIPALLSMLALVAIIRRRQNEN